MKFSLSVTAAALLCSTAAFAQDTATSLPQQDNEWFASAQETLQQLIDRQENTNRALNVILFVADGNGVGTNYATRLFEGQQQGGYGDDHNLPQDEFPFSALVKTTR